VDRSGPASGRIEMSRSVREVLSSAVGLAGERPVDASVVLLAALLYAHKTRLPGMTSALLLSLSNLPPYSRDPEDLLVRLGQAIGITITDVQASTRVIASRMAVAPLDVLLTSASQVAKRLSGHSNVHLRHLVAAAILATEPPLRPQALRELGISEGQLRELLREAALAETSGEPVGAWRDLISPSPVSPSRRVGSRTGDSGRESSATRDSVRPLAGRSVFVSYSHKDELYREKLRISLSQLQRENLITVWHDRKILPGQEWEREIDRNLENAEIVLLLVSPDFLASEYCTGREMLQALERHRSGSATVVPIIVRPSDWQNSPLASLQALPTEGRPVSSWKNKDKAWLNVARGLRQLISG
jgi:TIR domain